MNLTITPGRLSGTITPPPSKSLSHRYLIAASLAGKGSVIHNLADSQDIQATRRCMAEFRKGKFYTPHFDCGESGSTLRFLLPIALALQKGGVFTGHGRLMERPQKPYFDLFDEKGIQYEQRDGVLTVRRGLPPGEYRLPGNVSSQFFTGLLYALPLVEGDSEVIPTTPLESRSYVDMTLEVLAQFDVAIREKEGHFLISGRQRFRPREVTVEADWSQAAFWLAAHHLGSTLELLGLNPHSVQGDRVIARYTADLSQPGDRIIDVSDCPDLVPPLAVMAAVRQGTTSFINAARLRIKESDRLATVTAALNTLGAAVEEHSDSLAIRGKDELTGGGTVDCCNDHRIAMMSAIAATRCQKPVTLLGAECVAKSYPDFWDHYRKLGGNFHEYAGE